jgi:hypothetical protein
MNSPVYAPSAEQGGVGGVDDGINLLKGNIPLYQLKHGFPNVYLHEHLTGLCISNKLSCFVARVKTAGRREKSSRYDTAG